jgi:hypothetical protein
MEGVNGSVSKLSPERYAFSCFNIPNCVKMGYMKKISVPSLSLNPGCHSKDKTRKVNPVLLQAVQQVLLYINGMEK